jgi:signal transduction histidine kinase
LRGKSGEYRWFLSRALPIRDAGGKVLRWFGTNTDITESRRMEAERERLQESRARLIRGFSHDLRNPLGVADAQAWLLESGKAFDPLQGKQQDSVGKIRKSIQASLRLIDDLLELSRAEAGQIEVQRVPIAVAR